LFQHIRGVLYKELFLSLSDSDVNIEPLLQILLGFFCFFRMLNVDTYFDFRPIPFLLK
jgi:hypothetical protein